jgi:tetratricopeptide (TPR) repeat protein
MYLPLMGMLLIIAETRDAFTRYTPVRRALPVFAALLIGVFSLQTFRHCNNFICGMIFWKSAVESAPSSPEAHNYLGMMYMENGFPGLAGTSIQKALELDPRSSRAHLNLGVLYWTTEKYRDAEREFRTSLSINPYTPAAYINYAALCYEEKRYADAESLWMQALELNPYIFEPYRRLIDHYLSMKDVARTELFMRLLARRLGNTPDAAAYLARSREKMKSITPPTSL